MISSWEGVASAAIAVPVDSTAMMANMIKMVLGGFFITNLMHMYMDGLQRLPVHQIIHHGD
jgi:hypothetical protein